MLAGMKAQEHAREQAVLRERLQPIFDTIGAALTDLNPKEALSVLNAVAIDVLTQAATVNDREAVEALRRTFIRIVEQAPLYAATTGAADVRRDPGPGPN